jgi:hypothetical protein
MKTSLAERLTDRSFLLTVMLLVLDAWLVARNTAPETILAFNTSVAPFILGEKYKDAQAAKNVAPQNVNIGQADSVDTTSKSGGE